MDDAYVCPSLIHADLKSMRKFLVEIKQENQPSADSTTLLSWWR